LGDGWRWQLEISVKQINQKNAIFNTFWYFDQTTTYQNQIKKLWKVKDISIMLPFNFQVD